MWRGKVAQQIRARKLRSQGRSVNEVARLLKVSKSSASIWVRNVSLGSQQRERLRQRELRGGAKGRRGLAEYWKTYHQLHPKAVSKGPRWPTRTVESFFDIWTPEMAYVLGYFSADGCMYRNTRGSYYVGFASTDKELIDTTKALMSVTNAIEEYQSPKPNHKRRYTLQIGSRRIFQQLLALGFMPNKSLKVKLPDIPSDLLRHFVRGYFDGDGSVLFGVYSRKNRPGQMTVLVVRFTSGSKAILVSLRKQLNNIAGIGKGSLITYKKNHHALCYSTRDARQLYSFMYPSTTVPCLTRKKLIFVKAINYLGP